MALEIRQASARFVTADPAGHGPITRHSFSFGAHYDPGNVGFGALVAHNDEQLPPGSGYPDHPHADVEIVTLVLDGALRHTSSVGSGLLGPGDVQRLSAGSGVVHAEMSEAGEQTRFLQTWVRPEHPGGASSYERASGVEADGLVEVVGPNGLAIGAAARLYVAHLTAGEQIALPDAGRLHLFVVAGVVLLGAHALEADDAARLVDEGGREVTAATDAQVAIWAMDL